MGKINLNEFTSETRIKETGVYMIIHLPTNIKYVGSTACSSGFSGRWKAHLNDYLNLTRGSTSKVIKGKAKTLKRKYIPVLI